MISGQQIRAARGFLAGIGATWPRKLKPGQVVATIASGTATI
jgi:hypothetical protein